MNELNFLFFISVFSWNASEPLNPTLNDDGSVNVTCMFYGEEKFGLEAKLIMNDKVVCEIYQKGKENDKCKWQHNNNTFTFTLMNPGALHQNVFFCQITKITPLPIRSIDGPKIKLFRGKFTLFEQHSTVMYKPVLYTKKLYIYLHINLAFFTNNHYINDFYFKVAKTLGLQKAPVHAIT